MSWKSATVIMDEVLTEARSAIWHAMGEDVQAQPDAGEYLDDLLRPLVRKLAGTLRDGDWDGQQNSAYFEQFMQEMLGYDDQEYTAYLVEQVKNATDYQSADLADWTERLVEHQRKTGQQV